MARTPKVINVGKSYLVYQGDEYQLKGGRVVKHVRDRNAAGRKKKDLKQVIAVFSEILHNDLTLDYHRQMMDKAEINQFLAKAKRKNRKITEASLRQSAKAEAILKTEFHDLDAVEPPANPLFRTRSSGMGSLFLLLSPINLYTHFALFWTFSGRDIASLPVSAENFLSLWIALLILYAAVIIHALHWLFTISAEIQASREIKLQVPSVWYYILALILPIGGYFFSRGFETESSEVIAFFSFVASIILGIGVWLVFTIRFFQRVGRLIGQPLPYSIFPALPFILLPPVAHISIGYFQERLNILDKNKMNFLVS